LRVIVEADGGARGNPGPAGYGAVVIEANTGEVLAERFGSLGIATNNVAEYSGLIAGLEAAAELGAVEVEVRMDSKLVVEQMSGRWQIKNPGLRPLAAKAADLVRRFSSVTFGWIPRERNSRADALANRAMDSAAGKPPGKARTAAAEPALPRPPAAGPDSPGRLQARQVAADATRSVPAWGPRLDTPLRLFLVRHGETELTAQRRYSGRGDVPLTQRGEHQGAMVAARIRALGVPIDAVVTSPLERCMRTAEQIAADQPVVVEPDLIECDFGIWEGLTFAEVRERWPDQLSAWLAATKVAPPGGESFAAVGQRIGRAMARLRQQHPTGTVVVVSHVSPLKIVLRDALDARDAFLHRCYLDPAGLSIVDFWPDGGVAVRTINDTAHLR
jgi:ribonuclease H / adenosylcobalamin/alpha-ribazole phosphatase